MVDEMGASSPSIVAAACDWRAAGMQLQPYSDRNVGREPKGRYGPVPPGCGSYRMVLPDPTPLVTAEKSPPSIAVVGTV